MRNLCHYLVSHIIMPSFVYDLETSRHEKASVSTSEALTLLIIVKVRTHQDRGLYPRQVSTHLRYKVCER